MTDQHPKNKPPLEPPAAFTVAAHRRANRSKHHPLHKAQA